MTNGSSVDSADPHLIPDHPRNPGETLFSASVTLGVGEARVADIGRASLPGEER